MRIRPAEEPPGNDPSAVMARIEIKAARGDATGANADLMKLPEKARAPAADWQKKLAARDAALAASRQLAADTARALARP